MVRRVEGEDDEGEVELPGGDPLEYQGLIVELDEVDGDVGSLDTQPTEDPGQDADGHRLEGAHGEPSDSPSGELTEVELGDAHPVEDRLGVNDEPLTRLGEAHRLGAARAVEERLPDDPLEGGDLLAHRRLRVAEVLGGPPERPFGGDGKESDKVAELDRVLPAHAALSHDNLRARAPPYHQLR